MTVLLKYCDGVHAYDDLASAQAKQAEIGGELFFPESAQGGPAFPTATYEYDGQGNVLPYQAGGLSLRDYFAAKALNGLLSYSYCNPATGNYIENCGPAGVASAAYGYADEMLKARQQ